MKRKTADDTFNPVSFNMGLAQQVLGRKREQPPTAQAEEPKPAKTEGGTAEPAVEPKPAPKPKPAVKRRTPEPEPAMSGGAVGGVSNSFRGGPRQDLRVPLDEQRRDDLADLARRINRKLRSRLPEAVTFRALLTVMLAAEDAILDAAGGSALNRTPARQDVLAATEAERDVALLLAGALGAVDLAEVERRYAEQIAELDGPTSRAA